MLLLLLLLLFSWSGRFWRCVLQIDGRGRAGRRGIVVVHVLLVFWWWWWVRRRCTLLGSLVLAMMLAVCWGVQTRRLCIVVWVQMIVLFRARHDDADGFNARCVVV